MNPETQSAESAVEKLHLILRDAIGGIASDTAALRLITRLSEAGWTLSGPGRDETLAALAKLHHDLVVVMQAACIEWSYGKGPVAAMTWISNTLEGPGLLPGAEDPWGTEAQAYFDANRSDPLGPCGVCERPSNHKSAAGVACSASHLAALEGGGARALPAPAWEDRQPWDHHMRCLAALIEAEEALALVVRETEGHRFGRTGYDRTLDHLYEECEPSLRRARAAIA